MDFLLLSGQNGHTVPSTQSIVYTSSPDFFSILLLVDVFLFFPERSESFAGGAAPFRPFEIMGTQ